MLRSDWLKCNHSAGHNLLSAANDHEACFHWKHHHAFVLADEYCTMRLLQYDKESFKRVCSTPRGTFGF